MRAEIGIVVAQVGRESVHADIFRTVRAADRYKLPLFGMHYERFFEGARAEEFYKSHGVLMRWDLKGTATAARGILTTAARIASACPTGGSADAD